jgi:hypothetical protein
MASYDDLHFAPSSSSLSAPVVQKVCLNCIRVVEGVSERLCPSCGSHLRPATTPAQQAALRHLSEQRNSGGSGSGGSGSSAISSSGVEAALQTSSSENPINLLSLLLSRLGRGGEEGREGEFASLFTEDGGNGSIVDGTERPAAKTAIDALVRLTVQNPLTDLPRSYCLRLLPQGGELVAIPASFGLKLPSGCSIRSRLIFAEPRDGATDLKNIHDIKGNIAIFSRGVVSFAVKALKAEAAGALGVVVINSKDCAWPYTMSDSSNVGKNLSIPVVMVRYDEKLVCETAELKASSSSEECAICCECFDAAGGNVILMPCQHPFHERCLLPWLEKRHTCPLCRIALPEEETNSSLLHPFSGYMRQVEHAQAREREREEQVNRDWFQ